MPETEINMAAWNTVAFGDVVRQVKDKVDPEESGLERYVAGEHMDTDDLVIHRWGKIGDDYLGPAFHMRFKPGHVLYGSRRTYLRKVALADFEGITANTTFVLESKDPNILRPDLLPFIMQTEEFHAHSKRESKGSVNPYVNFSDLAWYEFALPSLEEQSIVLEGLTACESSLDALGKLHRSLVAVLDSLSNELLRPKAPELSTPLSEFASIDIHKVPVDPTVTYKTVGVLNKGAGLFIKDDLDGSKTKYKSMVRLRSNQIVMRKLTAWEGAITVVPEEHAGAVVSTEFPTLSLDESVASAAYLRWVFRQSWFWHEMKARSKGTALRRSRLNPKDLLEIRVNLPSMKRQQEIVESLEDIAAQMDAILDRRWHLIAVKKRLLESFPTNSWGHAGTAEKTT